MQPRLRIAFTHAHVLGVGHAKMSSHHVVSTQKPDTTSPSRWREDFDNVALCLPPVERMNNVWAALRKMSMVNYVKIIHSSE